ncbi:MULTISPECIES: pyridoxal phosphate-dependent aminotransferase [Porphyromonadaceae]|uniref:pyridoxal phosphate-dependent aminotransferase n=1 Tax=Porphyromonadaceae TaxID=171551 RepID=UPI000697BCBD|nr:MULTISPECIES: threonine-phosphate decarboxylase [Porphyromonadaceae]PXZ44800.1 pyridoxal phosphate-dependent class II aminotransferase [Sanguibacteroides justesenii]
MIHGHGDDIYKAAGEIKANFSTNVWYETDINLLQSVILQQMDKILHYPEPDAGSFVEIVARHYGISSENVIAGNGATELFYLIAHAFTGANTCLPIPSFTEYEDACSLYKHRLAFIPFSERECTPEEIGKICPEPELMFICNPNNPDGRVWELDQIRNLLRHHPRMTLVVDESFIDFAPSAYPAEGLLEQFPNLLVIHSMTKNFAIPGLRLGYLLGNEQLISRIKKFKQPWSINALAIEVGKYLLTHGEDLLPDTQHLLRRKQTFVTALQKIPGFRPQPSETSFFLVETDWNSTVLKHILLERYGLLIRDASNFRGLNNRYFRVNTLTDFKNGLLIEALQELGANEGSPAKTKPY